MAYLFRASPLCAAVGTIALSSLAIASPVLAQTVAGGDGHTVILKSDGTVWTFGNNNNGQLGDNTLTTRKTPMQVSGLTDVTAVAAGGYHSLALTSNGTLYVWGDNAAGQLGDGSTTDRKTPVTVSISDVVGIAAGSLYTIALRANGDVYTWGVNNTGQLGTGTTSNTSTPTLVMGGGASVGAGMLHSLVVKTDGTAWASGWNFYGGLGDGSTTQRTSFVQMTGITNATKAVGGERHSVILSSDGTVKATGSNGYGQVGDGGASYRTTAVTVSTVSSITAIAAGQYHSVARKSDGTVWSWGYNGYGQLGDGTTTNRTTPITLTALSSITALAAGSSHTISVTSGGVVSTWGHNAYGQLGDGTTANRAAPEAISELAYDWKVSTPVFSVAAGTYATNQTVVVTADTTGATIHYRLDGVEPTEADATVASGASVLIDETRTLKAKAWKSGMPPSSTQSALYTMKVALPSFTPSGGTYTSAQSVTMTTVTAGATIRYTMDGSQPTESSVAYAGPVSVATTTTLKALAFKANWSTSDLRTATFTMNFGTLTAPTMTPATGTYESFATVTMSALSGATIRYTTNGSTPIASSTLYTAPLQIETTTTIKAKAFHPDYVTSSETSRTYTITVADPGFAPTAGTYQAGQLVTVSTSTPGATVRYTINGIDPVDTDSIIASGATLVVGNYTLKAKAFKTGATASGMAAATYAVTGDVTTAALAGAPAHSLAIRSDGVAWAWGANGLGQVGDGTTISPRLLPRLVGGLTGVATVSGGDNYSLVLRTDGTALSFGYNNDGRLGDGTTTSRSWPTGVSGLTGVVAIAAGDSHGVALKSDGSVSAWGSNGNGEIGDGSTTQRLTPTAVSNVSNATAVAAGNRFSLALTQSGGVYSWGQNSEGQLGDGTTTSRSTRVPVLGLTTATAVAAGAYHALAILADGTVRSWGYNYAGQLGDGTTTNRTTPIEVPGLTSVVAVAAGMYHSVALTSSGTVWTWGGSYNGQLGHGTNTGLTTPTQVSSLSDITAIAAGDYHTLALTADGTVWVWGRNDYGQLGDGTTTERWAPVPISGPDMSWRAATPTVSLASGIYLANQVPTVTVTDSAATIRYTLDGNDPTDTSASVVSGGTIAIDVTATLKVSTWKPGALTSIVVARAYELKVMTPVMTPGGGAYGSPQSVSSTSATPGASIRYTFDGSEPIPASLLYSGALNVDTTLTLKARGYKAGWTASDSGFASYWVDAGTVATPTISPAAGTFTAPALVALTSATAEVTIRYTLNGTTPDSSSAVYEHPLLVGLSATIKARAFRFGYAASAVASAAYAFDPAGQSLPPSIAPAGGRFATRQTVIVTGTSGATLRYTTTGVDPTETAVLVPTNGQVIVDRALALKVRAWSSGLTPSAVVRGDFLVEGAVIAGRQHSLAVAADGTLYAWGYNLFGELGDGTQSSRFSAVAVLSNVLAAAAGNQFSVALRSDQTVWTWGKNSQLSRPGSTLTPGQVPGLSQVTAIAAGRDHVLALKGDGSVWAFGANGGGQLGDGTTTARWAPAQVSGLTGVTQIAGGDDHSLAVQTSGGTGGLAWSWGANAKGQLGDGSVLSRLRPVRVAGLEDVVEVAAGREYSLARLNDGTARAWGVNDEGQLGIGSTTSQALPVVVPGLLHLRHIVAAERHALAVDDFGGAWGWGSHTYGQLGYEPASISGFRDLLPVRIRGASAVVHIAGGWQHTLMGRVDGTVLAVGGGGVLGDGTATPRLEPVFVTGLSLAANASVLGDPDNDGLATWLEHALGFDPLNADTNGDGFNDRTEASRADGGANPDGDGDGVPSYLEALNGTDPFLADSDGDTVNDGVDAFPLDATRTALPSPNPADTTPPVITLKEPVSAVLRPPV